MLKKISKIMMVLFCLCILFIPINVQASEIIQNDSNDDVDSLNNLPKIEAFYIKNLDIQMDVQEDGLLKITETYDLYFHMPRRGFYRTIPSSYEMTWDVEGETVTKNYFFPIRNINSYDTKSKVEKTQKGTSIRLGDPDQLVQGDQKYKISYEVQTRDLDLDGMQVLYWNLVGDGFHTYIHNLTFSVHMPKAFDTSQVYAYSGRYGSTDLNIETNIEGNRIVGKNTKMLYNNEAVTLKVNLDNGYFTFATSQHDYFPVFIISFIILWLALNWYRKYGKDDEVFVSPEFAAPDGLNSAEIGYIIDGMADDKDIFSLIIDWARRGYIIIHEKNKTLSLEKIKDLDTSCPKHEYKFFESLFHNKSMVTESDLQNKEVRLGLRKAKRSVHSYFRSNQKRVFTKKSNFLQIFMILLTVLPTFLSNMFANYAYYEIWLLTSIDKTINALFFVILIIWVYLFRKRHTMKVNTFQTFHVICMIMSAVCMFFTLVHSNKIYDSLVYNILYCIITSLLIYATLHMQKRTDQGNRWLGQILGLKEFIEICEKEKLEMLVNETPSAFFDILPYAYVLGVSDVWANKFEKIAMQSPDWYQTDRGKGTFSTRLWWLHFHSSFSSMSNTIRVNPNSNKGIGGGRISGGSFGGGFSGGGFGGGGGGSW